MAKIDLGVLAVAAQLSLKESIEKAIDECSIIEVSKDYVVINGLRLIRNQQGGLSYVMNFHSPKILKVLEPTDMEIRNKIAELNREIEELKSKLK